MTIEPLNHSNQEYKPENILRQRNNENPLAGQASDNKN